MQALEKTPRSLATGFGTLLALLAGVSVFAYWFEGMVKHQWWSGNYILSFAIPFAIAMAVQYVWFVPRRLAWDDQHVEIVTWLGGDFRAPWSELHHWGSPGMAFTLEFGSLFGNGHIFQIALNYFTPQSVADLKQFLAENHADEQAAIWIGRHGVG